MRRDIWDNPSTVERAFLMVCAGLCFWFLTIAVLSNVPPFRWLFLLVGAILGGAMALINTSLWRPSKQVRLSIVIVILLSGALSIALVAVDSQYRGAPAMLVCSTFGLGAHGRALLP